MYDIIHESFAFSLNDNNELFIKYIVNGARTIIQHFNVFDTIPIINNLFKVKDSNDNFIRSKVHLIYNQAAFHNWDEIM